MHKQKQQAWHACWSCKQPLQQDPTVTSCPVCGALQPYFDDDPFAILGITPAYGINLKQVEEAYIRLQAQMHPDRFPQASDKEKRIAAANAATLNASYLTLRHPLQRAVALMKREGHEASADSEQKTIDDPELLMDMMTLREQLMESDNDEARQGYLERLRACEGTIEQAYRTQNWDEMDACVTRLRYILRLGEAIPPQGGA